MAGNIDYNEFLEDLNGDEVKVKEEKPKTKNQQNKKKPQPIKRPREEEEESNDFNDEVPFSKDTTINTEVSSKIKDRKVEEEIVEEFLSDDSGTSFFTYNEELPKELNNENSSSKNINIKNEINNTSSREITIEVTNKIPITSEKFKYMMDKPTERNEKVEETTKNTKSRLEEDIKNENTVAIADNDPSVKLLVTDRFQPFHLYHQEKVVSLVRIGKEANAEGNEKTYYIEGKHADLPVRTQLHLESMIKDYSIFPGQIVAVKGSNPSSKLFRPIAFRPPPMLHAAPIEEKNNEYSVSIMVCCGPYTTNNSLSYFPLKSLLKHASNLKPTVLLMAGPFVDKSHPLIMEGNATYENEEVTNHELFTSLIAEIDNALPDTHVILVPSLRDINHNICCYPQPPFELNNESKAISIQDPSIVSLDNGALTFGITSSDILKHIADEETFTDKNKSKDRSHTLVKHLLEQGSFYPLYPPVDGQNIESLYYEKTCFDKFAPHILITPSDLTPFVKVLNGVVAVNPGRVAKSQSTGTFSVITLHPASAVKALEDSTPHVPSIAERTRVDLYFV